VEVARQTELPVIVSFDADGSAYDRTSRIPGTDERLQARRFHRAARTQVDADGERQQR
jgi:hypothetical protein